MKKIYFILILVAFCLPVCAQNDAQARNILDKASAALKKAGGINARFDLATYGKNGTRSSSGQGEIRMKGNKFHLTTDNALTWFDGHTQWSYLKASDEVNISNPTAEELQNINPYTLIDSYRQGYLSKYGGAKTIGVHKGHEIILTPLKSRETSKITLFISDNYQPVSIKIEQKDRSRNEITVTSYKTGINFPEATFKFNKRNYPDAEIVDLR